MHLRCVVVIAAAACGAGTDPRPVDVTGRWTFTETFSDVSHGISCADTGHYDIVQEGVMFSGAYDQRGICMTPSGNVDNADAGPVTAGHVLGHTVSFKVTANCDYAGSATGTPPRELAGRGVCVLLNGPDTLHFNGTWRATR